MKVHFPRNTAKTVPPTKLPSPTSPFNMYIDENFAVRMHQYFKLNRLIASNRDAGIVLTEFDQFRQVNKMMLSEAAKKIQTVPNAGGNSVISEVLSYELLRKCFGAQLMKVGLRSEGRGTVLTR